MPRRVESTENNKRTRPPARTPEAREQQLIGYAIDLVEKRLLNGTASSQETTHYLKLASTRNQLEQSLIEAKIKLEEAKTQALESQKKSEEMFNEAIIAFKQYSGNSSDEGDEDYDDYDV